MAYFESSSDYMDKIEVKIDKIKCLGCEICTVICPEIFKVTNNSIEAEAGFVPKKLHSTCVKASESCPSEAILVAYPNVWVM